jgi:hypothetical protein
LTKILRCIPHCEFTTRQKLILKFKCYYFRLRILVAKKNEYFTLLIFSRPTTAKCVKLPSSITCLWCFLYVLFNLILNLLREIIFTFSNVKIYLFCWYGGVRCEPEPADPGYSWKEITAKFSSGKYRTAIYSVSSSNQPHCNLKIRSFSDILGVGINGDGKKGLNFLF